VVGRNSQLQEYNNKLQDLNKELVSMNAQLMDINERLHLSLKEIEPRTKKRKNVICVWKIFILMLVFSAIYCMLGEHHVKELMLK
jgi:hypothetical protein